MWLDWIDVMWLGFDVSWCVCAVIDMFYMSVFSMLYASFYYSVILLFLWDIVVVVLLIMFYYASFQKLCINVASVLLQRKEYLFFFWCVAYLIFTLLIQHEWFVQYHQDVAWSIINSFEYYYNRVIESKSLFSSTFITYMHDDYNYYTSTFKRYLLIIKLWE